MNKYIEQQFAASRYERNILVIEEATSAGGRGSFNVVSSCPAPACLYDSMAWGFLIAWGEYENMSLKCTCSSCGIPLDYEGSCWECKCEQERQAALAWTPE